MPEATLLCVDDEDSVLSALRRLLRKEGYRMLFATNGDDALELLEKEPAHVVLSDNRMPGMNGSVFLQRVKERHPDTVRMMLSGYAAPHAVLDSINKGEVYRFLPKPWNDDELRIAIRQCFEHYQLKNQNQALLEQVRSQNEALREWNENLERMVDERTRTLRFSQEVLEKLPLPVLGISRDGMVALANAAALTLFVDTHGFPLGLPLAEVCPAPVIEAVQDCLTSRQRRRLETAAFGPDTFRLQADPLHDGDAVRGCTLLFFRHMPS